MGRGTKLALTLAATLGFAACGLDILGTPNGAGAGADGSPDGLVDRDGAIDDADAGVETCDADLRNDRSNCSACGRSCGGGSCEAGVCSTFDLVTIGGNARSVFAGATKLYWSKENEGQIGVVDFDGANSTAIMNSLNSPTQVAVDPTHLYYVSHNSGELHLAALDGHGDQLMTNGIVGCVFPAGPVLYSVDYNQSIAWRVDVGTFQKTQLLTSTNGLANPWGIAVTGADLYWTNASGGGTTIWRTSLSGTGGLGTKIIDSQNNPNCLSFDGPYMYWANYGDGTIRRSHLDGSGIETIERNQAQPTGVAIGPKFLYWVSGDKIRAVAK